MKIGLILQAGVPNIRQYPMSGPANHVKQVFFELRKLGCELHLLAVLNGRIWKSDDFLNFDPVTVRPFEQVPFSYFESVVRRIQSELQLPYLALFESMRFAKACQQELHDVDLLYERMGWMGYGGALASRWMNKPLVLEVNGDHLTEMDLQGNAPEGLQRYLSEKITGIAVHQAVHSVATGDGWQRNYIQRWGAAPETVSVIENGSELVELLDRASLSAFSEKRDNTKVRIAYVGGFDPWHGLPILVQSVSRAVRQGLDLHVFLIGKGSEEGKIKEIIRCLSLEDRVTFTGHVDIEELANYLKGVDIGVSPYCGRDEYSGLKLLDYKAAGLAIIASGAHGEPEVIEHGRTGLIVPPCDELALCEAIIMLVKNVDFRKRLGQTARIEAEVEHSWKNTAIKLHEEFTRLMAGSLS